MSTHGACSVPRRKLCGDPSVKAEFVEHVGASRGLDYRGRRDLGSDCRFGRMCGAVRGMADGTLGVVDSEIVVGEVLDSDGGCCHGGAM